VPSILSSNIFDNETTNALQAESVGTLTLVPPDLKRYDFGDVHCPAVSDGTDVFSMIDHHSLLNPRLKRWEDFRIWPFTALLRFADPR
jgi:hypothetical protein